MAEYLVGVARLNDDPASHHHYSVREGSHNAEIVGDEQYRPSLDAKFPKQCLDRGLHRHIQR